MSNREEEKKHIPKYTIHFDSVDQVHLSHERHTLVEKFQHLHRESIKKFLFQVVIYENFIRLHVKQITTI